MKSSYISTCACAAIVAGVANAQGWSDNAPTTPVSSEALVDLIDVADLKASAEKLQQIADENGGTRVFGSPGHDATVEWIMSELSESGYYDVSKQAFVELFSGGSGSVSVAGTDYESAIFTYSPSGDATGTLVPVANLGCEEADYPPEVEGQIALIIRGECPFSAKVLVSCS